MRIGIGLNLLAPDNGGVTNYVLTLLRHWPEFAPEHPMILFSFAHNEPLLATLPTQARRHEIRLQTQEEALQHFDKIDVYFCPFGTLWPRPVRKPSVLTFHDMQERFFPEFFTPKEHEERFFHYDWSLRMADAVIAISEFTRDMGVKIVGASRGKFHVVHHVPDALPSPERPANWNPADNHRPFVFYPANFWKHKNHLRIIAAMAEVRRSAPDMLLVCTGSRLGREAEWDDAIRASAVTEHVRHLGKVSRAEISWLYSHARALVFPSLFEGFGIPLLEAMQSGIPIACGHNTSQPDVAREAALYFDAADPASIAAAILRIHADEPLRSRLITAGQNRLRGFTVRRLIDGHLAAFATARRRHNPLRAWYNERVRLPRSMRMRTQLTDQERRIAAKLLHDRSRVPYGREHVSALRFRSSYHHQRRLARISVPTAFSMALPHFSIVMPTYNHGRWIETALRSIFDQGIPKIEVLVMDAVSTDDTPQILARYQDRIVWHRRKDKGQADAINQGLALAQGDIVAWLNSDDTYLPGAFARVEAAFAADPTLDFVYGDALEIDEHGGILTPNLFTEDCTRERFYFSHDYICQPTLFLRREVLARVGELRSDLRWFLDYQWLTRFFALGLRGKRLPHFLAANRDHPQTKTNSGGLRRWWEIMSVLASNPGPGPFLLVRRCVWIYSLEFVIKTLNATDWGANPNSSKKTRDRRAATLNALNRRFMKLVSPRSFDEIVQRYHRDIVPHGRNTADLWAAAAGSTKQQ